MIQADDITVPNLFAGEDLTTAEKKSQPAKPRKSRPVTRSILRMNRWQLFLQIVLFLCIGGFAYAMLARPAATTRYRPDRQSVLDARLQSLASEVSDLRQTIGSRAEENSLFLKIMSLKSKVDRELATKIARAVHKNAGIYGVDSDLVLALIAVESDFNPRAVSSQGAVGLLQVMPQWKKILGVTEDLSSPETSVKVGMQVLSFYLHMYRDPELALTAYNRGPGPVDQALRRGKNPRTSYSPRVLEVYRLLKKMRIGSD